MLPRDLAVLQLAEFFTEISRRPCVFKAMAGWVGPTILKQKLRTSSINQLISL